MLVVRIAQEKDIPAILQLTYATQGKLNTLPMDKEVITHKIYRSIQSCKDEVTTPGKEFYFFVMEDSTEKKIIGCCAIDACVGLNEPFYLYRLLKLQHISRELDYHQTLELLELNNDIDGATELCSLFLSPQYRGGHNSSLLSYTRLMFITCFPERFGERIFADIRGIEDKAGRSPFWEGVIQHFMPMNFTQADKLMGLEQRQFIADLMPKYPLYLELLPKKIHKIIGRAHPGAKKAKILLEQENFHYTDYINIFDAGPTLIAHKSDIKMLNQSQFSTLKAIKPKVKGPMSLIANSQLSFKVILNPIEIIEGSVFLSDHAAKALQLQPGDKILYRLLP